ncbi:MAG: hypothetical protein OXP28_14545 [Gammaproteobacteria bacterium]|nr:hypothetical protein [Gammaproteobacteria bacterium]
MTESEQDAVIGQAFREHQEAAKEFACIRVKARRTADTLKQVAESVQKIADAESVTKPRLSDYPAPDDLADLFQAYRETHSRLYRSQQDLIRLGVRNITFVD